MREAPRAVVVGAGVGGLTAALRLRQLGHAVTVLEARPLAGGLASPVRAGGRTFDGGPYILLDRTGLGWAFERLGLDVESLPLRRLAEVYSVEVGGRRLRVHADLAATADGFEEVRPGAGAAYRGFVADAAGAYDRLRPALFVSRPGLREAARGGWRAWRYLLRSLDAILGRAGLPPEVRDTLAIWTRIAGHEPSSAPGFMALVPALIHGAGAFACASGLGAIPDALLAAARARGVDVRLSSRVAAIRHDDSAVQGVDTAEGEHIEARLVVSNVGLATYGSLLSPRLPARAAAFDSLPLQSPGLCAYVVARGRRPAGYLSFRVEGAARLLVSPASVEGEPRGDDFPLRLVAPMAHAEATARGEPGQEARLAELVEEAWWRDGLEDVRVVTTRVPARWGREFSLYRDAMNPVMTPGLARRGRLPHRDPALRGLYLAGSATHPGQWVSFCCLSGILAAERAHAEC